MRSVEAGSPREPARAVSFGRKIKRLGLVLAAVLALAFARDLALVQDPPETLRWPEGAVAEVALVPSGDPGARTRRAVALLAAGRVRRLVFSGAGVGGDAASNLAAQARILGAPEDLVWVEPTATNTYENLRATLALLDARGARPARLVIVTSHGHAARAGLVARRMAPDIEIGVVPVPEPRRLSSSVREALKLLGYRIMGRIDLW